jgi:hypothetical protein
MTLGPKIPEANILYNESQHSNILLALLGKDQKVILIVA